MKDCYELDNYRGWEISRKKEFGLIHTGVILKNYAPGEFLILHNHPKTNVAVVDLNEFLEGQNEYYLRRPNLPIHLVEQRLIYAIKNKNEYDAVNFNCQHFSSSIVDGIRRSADLNLIVSTIAFLGFGFLLLKFSNKGTNY